MHGTDREQHRDRGAVGPRAPIAQNEDPGALTHGTPRRAAQPVERGAERVRTGLGLPGGREGDRLHAGDVLERSHFAVQQDGVVVPHQPQPVGAIGEQ